MARQIRKTLVGTPEDFAKWNPPYPLDKMEGAEIYWGNGTIVVVAPQEWCDYLHGKTNVPPQPVCDDTPFEFDEESFLSLIGSETKVPFKKADNVVIGSVVITQHGLDIGLVKRTRYGKPTEIYGRKDKYSGSLPNEYGGVETVEWFDTGITMTLEAWIRLAEDLGDAGSFHRYWTNRLGL